MNKNGRRFIVGDIHGCSRELRELLSLFKFKSNEDELYSVGDITGRGPDTAGALKLLHKFNARVVRGNHDHALLLAAAKAPGTMLKWENAYLESLGPKPGVWLKWMSQWPCYIEMPDIIIVHGGLDPRYDKLEDMQPDILMNIRTWGGNPQDLNNSKDAPWYGCVVSSKTVIFGHWAQLGKVDIPGFKGLDTGCVYGNALTAYCPEEDKFYSVPSRKAYASVKA